VTIYRVCVSDFPLP